MMHTVLRLRRIGTPSPNPALIFLKSGDILGRTPYCALYHPRNDGVINCGITFENAGDQIPIHLLPVLNVSSTFIELAFVNVRINNLPFRIYLHLGDFLDLGFDNRFQVIDPMDEEDEGEDNEDKANDSERDLEGEVADELKGEEHGNNSCLSPNRCDKGEEEQEEQQSPPQTTNDDVDPHAADAPKTSTDDDGPSAAQAPPCPWKEASSQNDAFVS
jgi:hypothetical protein